MLDLPLLPALTKHTIPVLTIFAILLTTDHKGDRAVLPGWIPKSWTQMCSVKPRCPG